MVAHVMGRQHHGISDCSRCEALLGMLRTESLCNTTSGKQSIGSKTTLPGPQKYGTNCAMGLCLKALGHHFSYV